ncbi:MAG: hypothetical protein AB8G05_01640 [Oligoflexales bacterium]
MARKWLIHNDDGTLRGPWDAGQIRKALRKGLIDPFVTVSEEGSQQKQELIEIDAIFDTADEVSEKSEPRQAPGQVTKVVAVQAPPPELAEDASFLGLADPSVEALTPKDNKERRNKVKKFFLIDEKNGKSNMLSAQEITHLYTSKKINNQYRVGKANAKGEISVAKFVKTYKQLSKKSKGDKNKRKKSPKTRTMPQQSTAYASGMSFGQNQQQIIILGLCFLLLVACGVLYLMIRGDIEFFKFQSSDPVEHHELKPRRAIKPKTKEDKKDVNLLDAHNIRKNTNNSKPRRQKQSISLNPFRSSVPKGVSEDSLVREISALKKYDNQLVTVGPLSFKLSDLDECRIKCSIAMRDKSNREMLVIFFKDAYISELTGKGSQVYVQGTVREQGASLYLSQVF